MTDRICDITISPLEKRPLGGLNPYNEHFGHIGNHFCKLLTEHAGLNVNSKILDVGCGTGRLAKPISRLLDGGEYVGVDVNNEYIEYCIENHLGTGVRFDHLDVRHDEYNPTGIIDPSDVRLPLPDNYFDITVAIALFNHMETRWVFRYISEMTRVLKPKGILFATFLILNSRSTQLIEKDPKAMPFEHRTPDSWHRHKDRRLINVAIPESGLRQHMIKCGLMVKEPIRYGEWCGSPLAITGHDVVVAIKGQWR